MSEDTSFFSKIPTFNATIARFVTVFFVAILFLVISEGRGVVGAMIQHYYELEDEAVERSILQIIAFMLSLSALSGTSWALHKLVPVVAVSWIRFIINSLNLLLHVVMLILFVLVILVVFIDIPDSFLSSPCKQGVVGCGSYLDF